MARETKRDKEPRRAIALGDTAMAVIVEPDVSIELTKGFRLTVNGIQVQGQPSFADSAKACETLRIAERAGAFAIGDLANYMENRFGEQASQIFDAESGWNLKTLTVYRWLANRIDPKRRRMDRLTIKHHLMVASLSAAKQKQWLDRAAADDEDEPWTTSRLAKALAEGEDEIVDSMWLLVAAKNNEDLAGLRSSMEAQGRSCKEVVRRRKSTS